MGPPAPTARPQPLDGVTVIAVEQYGAGPFGTMLLADLGADVIKIENPASGGEVGRHVGLYWFGEGDSHFYQSFNRNKRSMMLDLKHPEAKAVLHGLVAEADAVFNNLRGDLPVKLGLTYDALKAVNPRIVCTHLSAYGRGNARESWPGYDYLMQAEAGYLSLTGEPDGPPARFGLSIVDLMTGLTAALGLVSGVVGARQTGRGMDVDASLFDTALQNLCYLATWYLNEGHVQGRELRSGHPSLTPSQLYRTRDGWLFIMANKEKFWPILAEALGHPEWATDPRLATFRARLDNRALVTDLLDAALMQADTATWIDRLGGRVPVAPVNDVAQALDNPFVTEGDRLATFERRDGEASMRPPRMLTGPLRVDGQVMPTRAAPALGADTDAVLAAAGFDGPAIARLREAGVVK